MRVLVRNPQRREIEVQGKRRVLDLLQELGLNPESHIVIKNDELLTGDDWVQDEDVLEVISAVSGGRM